MTEISIVPALRILGELRLCTLEGKEAYQL
jgi:hypothetical protein